MEKTRSNTRVLRKSHLLKRTVSKARPKRVIFFDTETKPKDKNPHVITHILKLGYAMYTELNANGELEIISDCRFYDIETFWDFINDLCTSKTTTYLVAHNLTFDLTILAGFAELPKRGWELQSFYSKGMVSLYRWKRDGSHLYGQDNTNIFQAKLSYWGELFGVEKLDIDFENTTDDDLMTYCIRDTEIMRVCWNKWLEFLDANQCGQFKPTVASTAFSTWRHRFMPAKVHIHSDELAIELERESYKGGRTECLFVGTKETGKYYYLDINNMYGYVLQNFDYPAGLWGSMENPSLWQLAYKLQRYSVTARVTVNIDKNVFPFKIKHHTTYPLGEFETTLTTPELKYCVNNSWLVSVQAMSWYRSERLFERYITEFRELREQYQSENNAGFEKIVKLLINGLYGKFGQQGLTQTKIGDCQPDIFKREYIYDMVDEIYYDHIWLGGSIFRETKSGESFHSFPAIAAHVTAYARLYLYWFLSKVPYGHAYYMDTDSLIVDQTGYEYLKPYIEPHKIGMLKTERTSEWLTINAPKDYAMDGRTKIKGVKSDAKQLAHNKYEQWQWKQLNGIIRDGLSGEYTIKKIIKTQSRQIWSGTVNPNGWVQPFYLSASEIVDIPHELVFLASQVQSV